MTLDQFNQDKKISIQKASEVLKIDINLILIEAISSNSSFIYIYKGFCENIPKEDNEDPRENNESYPIERWFVTSPGYILDRLLNSDNHTFNSSHLTIENCDKYYKIHNSCEYYYDNDYEQEYRYFNISCADIYMTIGDLNNLNKRIKESYGEASSNDDIKTISPKRENNLLKAIGALIVTSDSFKKFKRSDGSFNENGMVDWVQTQLPLKGYHLDGIKERSLRDVFKKAIAAIENNKE